MFTEIGKNVEIGDNTRIGFGCFIPEGVTIGRNCFIGPRVTFSNDKYPMSPKDQWQRTIVEDGVHIGAGVNITPGLVIKANSLIGMGAILTRDVPNGTTMIGHAARPIREHLQFKQGREEFNQWFLGLAEGGGYFVISKNRCMSGLYYNFRFGIEMVESIEFFSMLQREIGGKIHVRKDRPDKPQWGQRVVLEVRSKVEISALIDRLDGLTWRTKKRKQFDKFRQMFLDYHSKIHGEKNLDKFDPDVHNFTDDEVPKYDGIAEEK